MKTQKSFFEQNGGTYTIIGDVFLPNLVIGEADERNLNPTHIDRQRNTTTPPLSHRRPGTVENSGFPDA